MKFSLPFYVSSGGDGSANVQFCASLDEAAERDSAQDEGWGESSTSELKLKFERGKLFYEGYDPETSTSKWFEVKEVI